MARDANEAGALTDAEAQLLGRYIDNECGLIGRMRARMLLRGNGSARQYVEAAARAGQVLSTFQMAPAKLSDDVWDKISRRIEQQERLEKISTERPRLREKVAEAFGQLGWGAIGGIAAAGLVFAISRFDYQLPGNSPPRLASNDTAQPVQLASGVYGPSSQRWYAAERAGQTPSFDWVKSLGHVRVIRKPSEGSTIFWIRKKSTDDQLLAEKNKGGVTFLDPRSAADPLLQGD